MEHISYKVGELVWAKMKGFAPWPGRVSNPPKDLKKPGSKKQPLCIYFFGTNNYAWIEEVNIKPYGEFKEQLIKSSKSGAFKEAVESIEDYIKNGKSDIDDTDATFNKLRESSNEKKEKTPKVKKDNPSKIVKRTLSDKSNGVSPAKMVRSNSVNNDEIQKTSGASTSFCTISPRKPTTSNLLDRPANIQRPVTPHLDLKKVTETLKNKNICPSSMKFGFLGLGIMGSGIVKNLLHSGHTVIVWNRNPDKCRDFVNAGATQGQTPSDVIFAADVTFSCITNPDAAKELVFGNCGVLAEIKNSKGYVEMTGIDAETSRCIGEAIVSRGGRYLEAQIQGSKLQAELGTLVILAAGDHALYDDCQSCFTAMGKSSFFIGDVGNASMMNLIIQLISGVTIAGLAEGMALADRVGLSQNDVVEILELTQLNCPWILEKGKSMAEGGFPTHIPLAHIQKDLKLALLMADRMEQSLPLTAATNELFKHAKRLGYGGHDASAVYIRARF